MIHTLDICKDIPLDSGFWWDGTTFFAETGAPDSGYWYLKATTIRVEGGDPYDDVHVLAFSESEEELQLFATLHGIPMLGQDCQVQEALI